MCKSNFLILSFCKEDDLKSIFLPHKIDFKINVEPDLAGEKQCFSELYLCSTLCDGFNNSQTAIKLFSSQVSLECSTEVLLNFLIRKQF